MRTSIATVCLSGTLPEKLEAAAAAGFDGVEIFEPDLVVCPASPEEIGARCADLGLSIDLYQPFRDAEGVDEVEFARVLHRARAKFEVMNRLGADTILVCSNVGTASVGDDAHSAAQLARLGDLADEYGVRLAYEALAWGRFVSTYRHAMRIVDLADHPRVGTCLDSFHILSRGDDPAGIEDIPAEKIFFVQLADAPDLSMDVLSWSRHHRVFPGQGAWDLPAFTEHLLAAGYDGPISLEIFNDVFRQSDVLRTAIDARRSLRWLEERTVARLARDGAAAAVPAGYAELPAVEDPTGFDFVEIRVADSTGIDALLTRLGFTDVGRHRTKDVHLWRLGDARICVNTGDAAPDAPAHLAGVGFLVDSPADAAGRAGELGSVAVPRRTGSDEHLLRGVVAPDGTEVFFCSDSAAWIPEFGPASATEADAAAGAAETDGVIDHVNLAQPWQHFDEAVLFFASALSLDPLPSHDVAGPLGLVRSQVMRTKDGAVRIPLNLAPPTAPDDGPHRAQHLAVRVDDLVAFARAARERGLDFLPIPANYYDDLAARFDLPADTLATLAELDLLYDRDGDGEFLHVFTRTHGRVFVEVLQRLGGYDGYGAPNAPVRLATQHALFVRPDHDTGPPTASPTPPG